LINIYGEGGGEQAAMVRNRIEAFFEVISAGEVSLGTAGGADRIRHWDA